MSMLVDATGQPKEVIRLIRAAIDDLDRGNIRNAESRINRLAQIGPKDSLVYRRAATIVANAKDDFSAIIDLLSPTNPIDAEALIILGKAYRAEGDFKRALESLKKAVEVEPSHYVARRCLEDLCSMLGAEGRDVESPPLNRRKDYPELPELRFDNLALGFASLLSEYDRLPQNYVGGPMLVSSSRSLRRWDGVANPKTRLLVICDHGYGDCLMYFRYLVEAKRRVGRMVIATFSRLQDLVKQQGWADEIILNDRRPAFLGDVDSYIVPPLLPAVMGPDCRQEPPYISAQKVAKIRGPSMNVGLAWAGNPWMVSDYLRSLDRRMIECLASVPDCTFHSLQLDQEPLPFMRDHRPKMTDFATTAEIVAALDLVITVDTSIAHLAGAMAVPVWIMLAHHCDWRWGDSGESTFWYPSARLFRQTTPGGWNSVLSRVVRELEGEPLAVGMHRK